MNNNFLSMWGCVICSTVFQAVGNTMPAAFWFGMAVVYAIFGVVAAAKS